MVGSTAMVACLATGRTVTLRDLGWGILAVAALAALRSQFIFIVNSAIFDLLLLPTTVLTASSVGSLGL